jgi:hypothetical protein
MFRMKLTKQRKLRQGNSPSPEDAAMPAPAAITDEQIRDAGQALAAAGGG